MVDFTVDITLYVTGFVFVAVNLFLAYSVIKYRHKEGQTATYEPENKKLEIWLTALTAVGVAAMLTPGLFVWAKFVEVPEDAHEVEAVGHGAWVSSGIDQKPGTTRGPSPPRATRASRLPVTAAMSGALVANW